MAGIALTPQRRSELLQRLLAAQDAQQPNPQTGLEAALRLGAQAVRQRQINRLQEQETARANTTRANEAAVLSKLQGGGDTSVFGPVLDQQGNQTNNVSLAQAVGQLGTDNPLGAAVAEQIVSGAFSAPETPKIGIRQIRQGDDFVTVETINGRPGRELARSPISSIQRVEQGPPGSFSGMRETPGNRDDLRERMERNSDLRGELAIAMRRNRDIPGAAGVRGATQAAIEGTLGQIPGVGDAATEIAAEITGADAREIARMRTQAKLIVARLVPVVTGDTSGRYTEQEQARTKEVQSQLELFKTPTQIDGALSEIQAISLRGDVRLLGQSFIDETAGEKIDFSTDEGINRWGNILVDKFALTEDDALEELARHIELLGQ